jgi:uncharacterized membrane protein YphA (DoxX/SURF4 family)
MKSFQLKNVISTIACYAFALLYIYAAASKLFDYENFRVQLGQSPLLSAFAGPVSRSVPLIEILISFLLLSEKFRTVGLFLAFGLMAMFTAYIYIMLNYSSYVPCSCGGVLEKMTWDQHLIFNVGFVILGAIAILVKPTQLNTSQS